MGDGFIGKMEGGGGGMCYRAVVYIFFLFFGVRGGANKTTGGVNFR